MSDFYELDAGPCTNNNVNKQKYLLLQSLYSSGSRNTSITTANTNSKEHNNNKIIKLHYVLNSDSAMKKKKTA